MPRWSMEKVLDRCGAVAREVVAPAAVAVDREARWPEESLGALQDTGLGGLVVPEEVGGLGHGLPALARVSERLGRECGSTALCFGMHCVGAAVIAAKATEEQRQRYLEPIAAGAHLTSLALSEAESGSHIWLPQTRIRDEADGFRITGSKTFVTSGGHADSYVLSVAAQDAPGPVGEFSCVVVEEGSTGMDWLDAWEGIGMRGNSSRTLDLRDVRAPPEALLGAEGDQIWYVFNVIVPYFLVGMAGVYLGVASGALEDARRHVTQRRHTHDGSRLAEQPVVQHRMGELWARVARTRQLVYWAAGEAQVDGPEALPAVSAAKADVADTAVGVVNDAMTLVGGIGYRERGSLERRLRDARASHVMAPITDVLRLWTGRAVLGEYLLAD